MNRASSSRGASHRAARKPTTTDGTAAIISRVGLTTVCTHGGASWDT